MRLWRHAVLLVPALFPVTLVALDTAVVRDLAPAADAVSRISGDGALRCAAVGAVLEGGRGSTTLFFLLTFAVVRHLVVFFQICLG